VSTGQRLAIARGGDGTIADATADGGFTALRLAATRDLAWTLYYPPIIGERTSGLSPDLVEAARLLRAGRVDEARAHLARIADGSAEAPARDALLAIVALTQGERETALQLAQAAVERQPSAVPALLALSYAQQALTDLDAARDAARRATQAPGGDGLAWARLA
jgi:tetratricopeptide (TPR) repeat protein